VSVRPDHQGKGISGLLTEHGLQMLREANAQGCALVGDPACYSRFGFFPWIKKRRTNLMKD